MTEAYKDLDALVPEDVNVKLGGVQYTLPGDLPLEIYVRVNKASELEQEDEEGAVDQVVSAMVDLFAWMYQDKPEETRIRADVKKVLRSRGIRFNTGLLQNIYKQDIQDAEDEAEKPTNSATKNS